MVHRTQPSRLKKAVFKDTRRDQWRLTINEKKRILKTHIFGVDIDPQAVEVSKLSLLLKVLEGETDQSIGQQMQLFHERALPNLVDNIKCGNSLIGPNYFIGKLLEDPDEMKRVNPFNWEQGFPNAMKAGGFNCIIGNPPYGTVPQDLQQQYFSDYYKHQNYQKDYYLLFLERYEQILQQEGMLGVIVSNTWLQSVKMFSIREYLTTHYQWLRILHLPEKVFKTVVDTHTLVLQKTSISPNKHVVVDIHCNGKTRLWHTLPCESIPRDGSPINVVTPYESQQLYRKIQNTSSRLKELYSVYNGIKPFEKGKGQPPQTKKIVKDKPFVKKGDAPNKSWSPLLRGELIRRYYNLWNYDYWVLYGPWLAAPRNQSIFDCPEKIMIRQTADSLIATIVECGYIARNNLHIILPKDRDHNLRYLLGIINSRLMDFFYTTMNPEKGEALAEVKKYHVEQLSIRTIDINIADDKANHDRMVKLVDSMLALHDHLASTKSKAQMDIFQRQIDATDAEIDRLVYDLYGLTEEEIAIVEGG